MNIQKTKQTKHVVSVCQQRCRHFGQQIMADFKEQTHQVFLQNRLKSVQISVVKICIVLFLLKTAPVALNNDSLQYVPDIHF